MSAAAERAMIAEFDDPEALLAATRRLRSEGFATLDALSPYRVEGLEEALGLAPSSIRWPMLIAALGIAAFAYGLEYWTAVIAYPINSGDRALHSWPVFLIAPVEIGALAAALAGFVAFLALCGLPRLRHPAFDWDAVERASIDRFFLILSAPEDEAAECRLRDELFKARALRIEAVR
jgi:hypothetical protein